MQKTIPEPSLSDRFGQIITGLHHATLSSTIYEPSLTESVVQKVHALLSYIVSEQTKTTLISTLQQAENNPHLILTNHRTYVNIALIKSYLYSVLQQEPMLTSSPAQRHTIVGPRVTYDPLFSMIARSLSHLIQTIPQTASIDTAFQKLTEEPYRYTQLQLRAFKTSCLKEFIPKRQQTLSQPGLIFLAPSGTTEPLDDEGKSLFLTDYHVSGSIGLIDKYHQKTQQGATIITTHERFDTGTVDLNAQTLSPQQLQQHIEDQTIMSLIAELSGGSLTDDPAFFNQRKTAGHVVSIPVAAITQHFMDK